MRRRILGAMAVSAIALSLSFAAEAKTLVYCSEGSPEGFNPQLFTSGTTFDASADAIFSTLVEFVHGTTDLRPGLAESWEVSDDGLVYTFKLRQGVKFQTIEGFTPSRDFNADDVVFSMERQLKPDHPYHKVSGGTYEYFNSNGFPTLLKSVEKVDDYTVRFTLNTPEAPFLNIMATDSYSILSAEQADKMMAAGTPEQLDQTPSGTGPFQLVAYQKDAVIRYKAHPDYWEGKAAIDDLVFAITTDASVRKQKLEAGECHVMPYPNPSDIAALKANADLQVMEQQGFNIGYLAFNTEKDPYKNKLVRQALNYAINKQAIIDAVFQGAGQMAKNPIPPTLWSYNDNVKDYAYDVEKAKSLLKEAGLENGFETDLWAMPVQRPYNPNAQRMAELVQADWAAVGVKANIVSFEWGEYLKRSQQGEHQTVLLGWTGDYGDPDNFLNVLLGCAAAKDGTNRARWCNADFDAAVLEAKKTSDVAKRTELYMKAQEIFKEEAPWVTVAHSVVFMPMRKNVTGYKIDPLGSHYFYGVDITE